MKASAAILCGGRGERLRPLTDYFQKTMIPIGPKRRPLLEYLVKLLVHNGVREITLLTGHRAEEIEHYFESGRKFGAKIAYSRDPDGLSGTANAVANAITKGRIAPCDVLVIYYGDIVSDLDIAELVRTHVSLGSDVTLVLDESYSLPVGVAEVKGGRVVSFKEKPTFDISVTTGNMAIGKKSMGILLKVSKRRRGSDLMTDFVPEVIKNGGKVGAFYMKGFWQDIGTIASYEKLNSELKGKLEFLEKGL
jgi:mannose-1-phosphate guanylyltransferase